MKQIKLSALILLINISFVIAQSQPAYELFNQKGKIANYDKMIKDLVKSDMVFFGEYHTNPISHWMQIEMAKSFYKERGDKLFFGAEMFENGNQLVLDEYLAGFYEEDKMLPEITQLWGNYATDYKPLVEFAKEKKLRFVASNIPRRYAAMINKKGIDVLDELSPEALAMIGPLKEHFDASVYADMKDKMGGHVPPNMLNIQTAQAAKDATMAHFSINNFNPGDLYFHLDGAYHSDYGRGIIWWVNKIKPGYTIKSITTVLRSEWNKMTDEEKAQIANYIIVVADNMTQTKR
ncbi:ChaN family lipoprotein [Gelidibacter pelagius]|uniref:ChaN family lipoprotein n=1 Tax=Gelidibacter pelagius TaxID=2819985 RepID=A0ABS3SWS6_9FLAO|nr:ChaN family lipoprotein [Gelidibacter pelagius]MBO3099741.1 ChaN family lipoprotein [Gelidibacter pelagius]